MGAKVKCLSDAGYFINAKDNSKASYIQDYFNKVVTLHGYAKNLPLSCRRRLKSSLIKNILAPTDADPSGSWNTCNMDTNYCPSPQIRIIQGLAVMEDLLAK